MGNWHTQHWHAAHYNALAKEIRELMPMDLAPPDERYDHIRHTNLVERAVLTTLALRLCYRFDKDNPNFDALKFLNQCSPDTDLYPLAELWEG